MSVTACYYIPRSEKDRGFEQDIFEFTERGARHDDAALASGFLLLGALRRDYDGTTPRRVSARLAGEELLGSVVRHGVRHDVHMRARDGVAIAFYCRATAAGFETMFMGLDRIASKSARKSWWRDSIAPRLEDVLNG